MKDKSTILVVDDDAISREIVKRILQDEYLVAEVTNGQEALERLHQDDGISLILLDIVMPIMDGYEFLEKLKQTKYNSIPVVAITAEAIEMHKEKAKKAGVTDFIAKPFNQTLLLPRIRSAIMRNQLVLLEKLKYISTHDPLTGLYNRDKMFEETKLMLAQYPNEKYLFIRYDIDRFRLYTSAMGEEEGNKLIIELAGMLTKMSNKFQHYVYGRMEADVFCICESFQEEALQEQIENAKYLRQHYREDYEIDATFGIYKIVDNTEAVLEMYKKASMAAEKGKHMQGINVSYYENAMSKKLEEEKWVVKEMKHALDEKQYKVYLQPKYDIAIDQPCGAEALVRWIHPEQGMISPGKFIPVFEKNGFIGSLDFYMCEEVCALLARWKQEKRELIPISVNLSRISLYNPRVAEIIKDITKKYEIESDLLQIEITESAYMSNPDLMKATIAQLQKEGFIILMDDFGSGYSSLNTLKEIDVDILKIDMKFMPNGTEDSKGEKILSAIIRMAGWLDIPVIAEGVETKEQRDFLKSIGCRYVQGYFYAKPMTVQDCEVLIEKSLICKEEVKTSADTVKIDAVWSSNQKVDEILNTISLPVMILESDMEENDIIRTNDAFIETFGFIERGDLYRQLNLEQEALAKQTFKQSKLQLKSKECELVYFDQKGKQKWVRMKVQLISQIEKKDLYCCTFTDITKEKHYEEQLESIHKLVGNQTAKKKMLIVDDLKISRMVLKDIFSETYEIIEASDGKEGVELLRENAEDIVIILLDIFMPEMDGYAFLEEKMKMKNAQDTPVIVISAGGKAEIELSILKMGVNDFITKPFHKDIVEQRVKNVLTHHGRFQQLIQEY